MPANMKDKEVEVSFVDNYAIGRLKDAKLVMPTEGTVAFNLQSSEAYVQKNGGAEKLATVDSGKLNINFVDRSFNTALVVSSDNEHLNINGRGVVDNKGLMSNDSSSATSIRGYLSGTNAEEAAYIFKNTSYPGTTVTGATTWKK
jgi:hypothetical protein